MSYSRLTQAEKDEIVAGLRAGRSYRAIADELGRDEATVRRAALRPEVRKRVRRSEQNARAYAKRQAAAEGPKSREQAAEDATARQSSGGADGRLLGIFTVGGSDEGYAGPLSARRKAELLNEADRARDARRQLEEEGWFIAPDGSICVQGKLRQPPPHPPISVSPERRELPALVESGLFTPDPEYRECVERYLAHERAADAYLDEVLSDLNPRDRDKLLPADIAAIRAGYPGESP